MIDQPDQVDRLLTKLRAALPLRARVTPDLAAVLHKRRLAPVTLSCSISWVSYAGDEGGIVCRLDFTDESGEQAFVSITHLRFKARLPLARDIAAYQKASRQAPSAPAGIATGRASTRNGLKFSPPTPWTPGYEHTYDRS